MASFFPAIEPYGIQSGFLDRFVDFSFVQWFRSHAIRETDAPRRDRALASRLENASPPPISRNRVPFGTLRSHTLGQSGKMEVRVFSLGNARRSFRTRRGARATLPHTPPTLHRSLWLLLSPPTSSLASTPSSSACRARSPTRTPVRRHRRADVPRDAKSAMIRPPRERRARARRDAPVGSDDPGLTSTLPAASTGPPPRARTSRPRATSRCVPSSCAFFEIFGDARGLGKKTRSRRRAGCGARSSRARARAAARAPGRRLGGRARALVAFPARSDARRPRVPPPAPPPPPGFERASKRRRATATSGRWRFSNHERASWMCSPSASFFSFRARFFSHHHRRRSKRSPPSPPLHHLFRLAPRAMRPTPPRRRGP